MIFIKIPPSLQDCQNIEQQSHFYFTIYFSFSTDTTPGGGGEEGVEVAKSTTMFFAGTLIYVQSQQPERWIE
jgi:hypothetical protein